MNILFITRGAPSEKFPMKGNYEFVQAKTMREFGHSVSVISVHWRSLAHLFSNNYFTKREKDGITIYDFYAILPVIPFLRFGRRYQSFFKNIAYRKLFKSYLDNEGTLPDILHVHSQFMMPFAVQIKKKHHIPIVLTEHWSALNRQPISSEVISDGKKLYPFADKIIAVSHALSNNLRRYCDVDSRVIFNMVDDSFFCKTKRVKKDDAFRFISVGRLVHPPKNYDLLIKAFFKANFGNDVYLDIIGDGPEYSHLKKLVEDLHLKNVVTLHGTKSPVEIAEMLTNSDCFVLASQFETFGIVYIEAMAKGIPVIATRCGGPEEFITEKDGLLIPVDDEDALVAALIKMHHETKCFDSVDIENRCYSTFSQKTIGQKINDVYQSCLMKKS